MPCSRTRSSLAWLGGSPATRMRTRSRSGAGRLPAAATRSSQPLS
ncbi:Uncharacterised protein [Bordetella pertussis]|nr:Uncharacterised protein [Bordetella pertussis]